MWVLNKNRLPNDTMLLLRCCCFWLRYLFIFFTGTREAVTTKWDAIKKGEEEIKLFFKLKFMVWGWLGNNYMFFSLANFFAAIACMTKACQRKFSKNNFVMTTTWRGSNSSSTLHTKENSIPKVINMCRYFCVCTLIFWNELNVT